MKSLILFSNLVLFSCDPKKLTEPLPSSSKAQEEARVELFEIPSPFAVGGQTVSDVSGYTLRITNPSKAEFFVPDTQTVPVDCKIADLRTDYCKKVPPQYQETCNESLKRKCIPEKTTCKELGRPSLQGAPLIHPLRTGRYWHEKFPYQLILNANFYYVTALEIPRYPYVMPCSTIMGPSISEGKILTDRNSMDHRKHTFDIFGLKKDGQVVIESNEEFGKHESEFQYAVGGVLIFKNNTLFRGRNRRTPYNRVTLALDDQGRLIVSAIWAPKKGQGLILDQVIEYLRGSFQAQTILQLDQGGSTYFRFESVTGLKESPGFDNNRGDHRPITNFLGIKGMKEVEAETTLHESLR